MRGRDGPPHPARAALTQAKPSSEHQQHQQQQGQQQQQQQGQQQGQQQQQQELDWSSMMHMVQEAHEKTLKINKIENKFATEAPMAFYST